MALVVTQEEVMQSLGLEPAKPAAPTLTQKRINKVITISDLYEDLERNQLSRYVSVAGLTVSDLANDDLQNALDEAVSAEIIFGAAADGTRQGCLRVLLNSRDDAKYFASRVKQTIANQEISTINMDEWKTVKQRLLHMGYGMELLENRILLVTNLPSIISNQKIKSKFPESVSVILPQLAGRHKGYAFVEYANNTTMRKASLRLKGSVMIDGVEVKVQQFSGAETASILTKTAAQRTPAAATSDEREKNPTFPLSDRIRMNILKKLVTVRCSVTNTTLSAWLKASNRHSLAIQSIADWIKLIQQDDAHRLKRGLGRSPFTAETVKQDLLQRTRRQEQQKTAATATNTMPASQKSEPAAKTKPSLLAKAAATRPKSTVTEDKAKPVKRTIRDVMSTKEDVSAKRAKLSEDKPPVKPQTRAQEVAEMVKRLSSKAGRPAASPRQKTQDTPMDSLRDRIGQWKQKASRWQQELQERRKQNSRWEPVNEDTKAPVTAGNLEQKRVARLMESPQEMSLRRSDRGIPPPNVTPPRPLMDLVGSGAESGFGGRLAPGRAQMVSPLAAQAFLGRPRGVFGLTLAQEMDMRYSRNTDPPLPRTRPGPPRPVYAEDSPVQPYSGAQRAGGLAHSPHQPEQYFTAAHKPQQPRPLMPDFQQEGDDDVELEEGDVDDDVQIIDPFDMGPPLPYSPGRDGDRPAGRMKRSLSDESLYTPEYRTF